MSERSVELEEKYNERQTEVSGIVVERPDIGSWVAVGIGVATVLVVIVFRLWGPSA